MTTDPIFAAMARPSSHVTEAIRALRQQLADKRAARPPLPDWMAPIKPIKRKQKPCQPTF